MKLKVPLDKEKIEARIGDIKQALAELKRFQRMTIQEFKADKDNFPLASYWVRVAIEAVLTIGTHILSRLPSNGKRKDYTQVIVSLGDYGVIPQNFAKKIRGMAGYRNRLIHLYWEVTPKELHQTLKENLEDFQKFSDYIKKYLKLLKI